MARLTDVDTELTEIRKPVDGDSIERVRVVDGVDDANDVGLADLEF